MGRRDGIRRNIRVTSGANRPWYIPPGVGTGDIIALYTPYGASSLSASYSRVAGSGGNASVDPAIVGGVAPTFDTSKGWLFDGSSQYILTGIVPDESTTVIVGYNDWVTTGSPTYEGLIGSQSGSGGDWYFFNGTDLKGYLTAYTAYNTETSPTNSPPGFGAVALSPGKAYYNGELKADASVIAATISRGLSVGAVDRGGLRDYFTSVSIGWIAAYSKILTQSQIADICAADPRIAAVSGHKMMPYGDSKTRALTAGDWVNQTMTGSSYREYPCRIAVSGRTVASAYAAVDAELADKEGAPDYVLWNLGVNDAVTAGDESTWKTQVQYIIDAMVSRWPNVSIYIMRVWYRSNPTKTAMINGWYDDIVAANPTTCFDGPDESVWLENGDNGVTYTTDGTHYSAAGQAECAAQWISVLP